MTDRVEYEYPELTREEFDARQRLALAELDGPEGDAIRDLVRWFKRRYPTPLDNLRYSRRKYAEWSRTRGIWVHPR